MGEYLAGERDGEGVMPRSVQRLDKGAYQPYGPVRARQEVGVRILRGDREGAVGRHHSRNTLPLRVVVPQVGREDNAVAVPLQHGHQFRVAHLTVPLTKHDIEPHGRRPAGHDTLREPGELRPVEVLDVHQHDALVHLHPFGIPQLAEHDVGHLVILHSVAEGGEVMRFEGHQPDHADEREYHDRQHQNVDVAGRSGAHISAVKTRIPRPAPGIRGGSAGRPDPHRFPGRPPRRPAPRGPVRRRGTPPPYRHRR